MTQDIANYASAVAEFVTSPNPKCFDLTAPAHYWIPDESGGAVAREFETPISSALRQEIASRIQKTPTLLALATKLNHALHQKNNDAPDQLHNLLTRLTIARFYGAVSVEEVQASISEFLSSLFINSEVVYEYLVPVCRCYRITEEVVLDQNSKVIPLSLGMLKYLTFIGGDLLHRGDLFTEAQPLFKFRFARKTPVQWGNQEQLLFRSRFLLSTHLAFKQRAFAKLTLCSPCTLEMGGIEGSDGYPPVVSKFADVNLLNDLKSHWTLLKPMELQWYLNEATERLAIAVRRYASSLSEPAPEACLALIISAETLLNIRGDTNELSFRYSLMAAVALGKDSASRRRIYDDFREAYGYRSKTVHGTASSGIEESLIARLKEHVACLLVKALEVSTAGKSVEQWVKGILDAAIEGRTISQ